MALPSPRKNWWERWNAPEGKEKARAGLKCESPAKITHATVPSTTENRTRDIQPIAVIFRYNNATATMHVPMATKVAPFTSHRSWSGPRIPRESVACRAEITVSRPGQKYDAYCANPTQPDAIDSGALKESCQTNRNDSIRPSVFFP